ncbi:MAG: response regulator transcription factor [Planctomycetes bacterium]|nr:response regulator transcription factor [Planctomycetota bacterium]
MAFSPAARSCMARKTPSTTCRSRSDTGMATLLSVRIPDWRTRAVPALPPLDHKTLARLREFVKTLHHERSSAVPTDRIVQLAEEVRFNGGVTIDFEASQSLGQPLVVLRLPAEQSPAACLDALSKREREIVSLIAEGLSNKQIAQQLFIALATVKDHVHRILGKTSLPNRAALAAAHQGRPS